MLKNRNVPIKLLFCLIVLLCLSGIGAAKSNAGIDFIVWTDFKKPFVEKTNFIEPKSIFVALPKKLLEDHESLDLIVGGIYTIQGMPELYLVINNYKNAKFRLGGRKRTKKLTIKTRYLKDGKNELHFYSKSMWPQSSIINWLAFDISNIEEYASPIIAKTTNESSINSPSIMPKANANLSHAIAVVIGNKNYTNKDIPPVQYADNDASAVRSYLTEVMGYKDSNMIFKADVTKAEIEMIFGTSTKSSRVTLQLYQAREI